MNIVDRKQCASYFLHHLDQYPDDESKDVCYEEALKIINCKQKEIVKHKNSKKKSGKLELYRRACRDCIEQEAWSELTELREEACRIKNEYARRKYLKIWLEESNRNGFR